jgi:hypothetical protein
MGWRRRVVASSSVVVSLVSAAPLLFGQGTPSPGPVLTLTVKNSAAFGKANPVPLKTALLVVTPAWEDIKAVTEVGGQEASGQPLFLSELAVVLSNRALDCATVFGAPAPTGDDFMIVAGKAEPYLPAKGWQTTSVGKVFLTTGEGSSADLAIDRFSADVLGAGLKKKVSKDGLKGNDGRLVLAQKAGSWTADFALKADDVNAEGRIPLTACSVTSRKKSAGAPLLGENRLLNVARQF